MTDREREAAEALIQILDLPDADDLPRRSHRLTQAGDPRRYRYVQGQPQVYTQHLVVDRENARA